MGLALELVTRTSRVVSLTYHGGWQQPFSISIGSRFPVGRANRMPGAEKQKDAASLFVWPALSTSTETDVCVPERLARVNRGAMKVGTRPIGKVDKVVTLPINDIPYTHNFFWSNSSASRWSVPLGRLSLQDLSRDAAWRRCSLAFLFLLSTNAFDLHLSQSPFLVKSDPFLPLPKILAWRR